MPCASLKAATIATPSVRAVVSGNRSRDGRAACPAGGAVGGSTGRGRKPADNPLTSPVQTIGASVRLTGRSARQTPIVPEALNAGLRLVARHPSHHRVWLLGPIIP